jgi:ABC-2 type transport system ATP-binding protein
VGALLSVRELVKHYPGVHAVNGVSFAIEEGCCFGLLGPNGAGKTTTVELIEGICQPTSGEIRYRGEPLGARFRQEAGIQFQRTALQEFLTVRETLRLFQSLYARTMDLEELVAVCTLGEFLDRDTRKLSGGQRQRVLLAIALVNDPEVVFLDEPTTGLDPQARHNFWELVEAIKRRKTVVLTTHYMEEAYRLCDEIAIMDHGRIIAQGTPARLLKEHFDDVVVRLPLTDFAMPPDRFPMPVMVRLDHVEIHTRDVNETVGALLAADISLAHLQIRARTLEDLFLELTGRELRA